MFFGVYPPHRKQEKPDFQEMCSSVIYDVVKVRRLDKEALQEAFLSHVVASFLAVFATDLYFLLKQKIWSAGNLFTTFELLFTM